MKKVFYLIGLLLLTCGWYSPSNPSQQVASMDVLAVSTDSASVGNSTDVWLNSYIRRQRMPYSATAPTNIASFGTVWASTDNHVYYTDATGTTTKMDN